MAAFQHKGEGRNKPTFLIRIDRRMPMPAEINEGVVVAIWQWLWIKQSGSLGVAEGRVHENNCFEGFAGQSPFPRLFDIVPYLSRVKR